MEYNSNGKDFYPNEVKNSQICNNKQNNSINMGEIYMNNLGIFNQNTMLSGENIPSNFKPTSTNQVQGQVWSEYNNFNEQSYAYKGSNNIRTNGTNNQQINENNKLFNNNLNEQNARKILREKDKKIQELQDELNKYKTSITTGSGNKVRNKKKQKEDNQNNTKQLKSKNYIEIFRALSSALNKKEIELSKSKGDLRNIMTALALDPQNNVAKYSNIDLESISQGIVTQIEQLVGENQTMSNLISYENSKKIDIELELIKKENKALQKQIDKLKTNQKY
ncbi:hypothetical protein TPHA_0M01080 [Tetrapisispora phaffii CBS 4417]|uniref:Uncharacterized protein n=1 Tax=Tetrapisispora phaffii (strain ATCC 24235 / CBS 4417 / NBRC 1672 / NRRL Y-8282 / UCD 70-5) TaxID=1071381 RepID=G8C0G8_TETPH|nr:hypothetical protein TPHA_0M01080 [Tetrapisispora phaffii CBS 4417]CCE65683.1 hypothetical protein TPHA_0M01080 [Tetrapisispora phaffii CBS 4417]